MLLEEALKTHLAANAALSAQIAARIYPLILPQNATLPALVYAKISSMPEAYTHSGNPGLIESRFQFSCIAKSYSEAKTLTVNVKKAMRPLERQQTVIGGVSGVLVAGAYLENEIDIYDVDDVEHLSQYHVPLDYLLQHEEDF